jgi:hypothetical protein
MINFENRKLRQPERLYSIYDKDMLTIMCSLAKSKQYFLGVRFVVRTNHNNLWYFLNERYYKWVRKIQAYDFDIEYVKGKKNIVVDSVSRKPIVCSLMDISTDLKSQLLVEYSKN